MAHTGTGSAHTQVDPATARAEQAALVAAEDTRRRQEKEIIRLRHTLKIRNLAIFVGSGVSLYSTADANGRALPRMSWRGLIRNGLDYYVDATHSDRSNLSKDITRAYEDLDSDDTEVIIGAATTLQRLLDKKTLFPTWLGYVFRDLEKEVRHPEMLTALRKLHEHGAMILTTNYDGLLEWACKIPPVDGTIKKDLVEYERKTLDAVFHPHGYWERPGKMVFNAFQYYDLKKEDLDGVKGTLSYFLKHTTVLFVGCGQGLEDPSMGPLLNWIRERQEDVARHHCILRRANDAHVEGPLVEIEYGRDYEELGPWLEALIEDANVAPEGTMNDIPSTSERRKIHDWISVLDQTKFHCYLLDQQEQDTGSWFLHRRPFLDWLSPLVHTRFVVKSRLGCSLLWLHGREGSGKTVLCAAIINVVQNACRPAVLTRSRDSLAYFYCFSNVYTPKKDVFAPHEYRDFLCSLITQLCPPNSVFRPLRDLYRSCTAKYPGTTPTALQLEETLFNILKDLNSTTKRLKILGDLIEGSLERNINAGEIFLVIDAMDKIPLGERDKYLLFLSKLEALDLQHLHVLVLSRDRPQAFIAPNKWEEVAVDSTDNRHGIQWDIRAYIRRILAENFQLNRQTEGLKKLIEESILKECDEGLFSIATHQMNSLRQLENISYNTIRTALRRNSWPDIVSPQIDFPTAPESSGSSTLHFDSFGPTGSSTEGSSSAEAWFNNYKRFLEEWIFPVIDAAEGVVSGPVSTRIAILDTGVDLTDSYIKGYIKGAEGSMTYRSWINQTPTDVEDDSGRGTHAVALLMKLAPNTDLFVAQIARSTEYDDPRCGSNIADAIRVAVREWKVDIILLPFNLRQSDYLVDRALREAHYGEILVFSVPYTYLEATDGTQSTVLSIYPTDIDGNPSKFCPSEPPMTFESLSTLGEEVVSSWPRTLHPGTRGELTLAQSGTSISATIAAGMFATLLFYARHRLLRNGDYHQIAGTFRGKKALLELLKGDRLDKNLSYLTPWNLFGLESQSVNRIREVDQLIKQSLEAAR